MSAKIKLTQNRFALVDRDDLSMLLKYSWSVTHWGYACSYVGGGNKNPKFTSMHRMIMNAKKGEEIDHINGNRLDNRRSNLRFCTRQQNRFNEKLRSNKTSKFKGVYWQKDIKRWRARIQKDGEVNYLGTFLNELDAAKAYDKAAKKLFGNFAFINSY